MAKRKFHATSADMPAERKLEARDGGMIGNDRSSFANMPQNVVFKEYPKMAMYLPEVLDDSIGGIDKQMMADHSKAMSQFKPKKV